MYAVGRWPHFMNMDWRRTWEGRRLNWGVRTPPELQGVHRGN